MEVNILSLLFCFSININIKMANQIVYSDIDYKIEKFTQFPALLEKEREKLLNKPVVMFCTGGIRCEKATALALKLGIKDVYQLEGGILKYFEEVGSAHYEGDCFVFDHRVAVTPKLEPNPENKNIRKSYQAYLQALHE